jgi:hypothetical protein
MDILISVISFFGSCATAITVVGLGVALGCFLDDLRTGRIN